MERIKFVFPLDLDAAASQSNAVVERFYSEEENSLSQPWARYTYCNPPFSQLRHGEWTDKAFSEACKGNTVLMLLPVATETKYWQTCLESSEGILFFKGRVNYFDGKQVRKGVTFASALVLFTTDPDDIATFKEKLGDLGTVVVFAGA